MAKDNNKIAKDIFKRFPKEDKCYVTSDGSGFVNKNAANLHATKNASGKVLKVSEYSRTEATAVKKGKANTPKAPEGSKDLNPIEKVLSGSVPEVADAISKVQKVEELDAFAKAEKEGDDRKGVATAIAERRAELAPKGGDKIDDTRKKDDN